MNLLGMAFCNSGAPSIPGAITGIVFLASSTDSSSGSLLLVSVIEMPRKIQLFTFPYNLDVEIDRFQNGARFQNEEPTMSNP